MKNNINVLLSNFTSELKGVRAGGKEEMRPKQNVSGGGAQGREQRSVQRFQRNILPSRYDYPNVLVMVSACAMFLKEHVNILQVNYAASMMPLSLPII